MHSELDKHNERLAAIEIDASHLHVCVSSRATSGNWKCETRSLAWREEATSLNSERGRMEVAAAMRRISAEMKLKGVPTWIALPGSYCVSRVVRGDEHAVRDELAQLEVRGSLYLSLGHGPKTKAASVHQIDGRRRHAVLSVTNHKTIETLTAAAEKAGLLLRRVEPSLVLLCRLVGQSRQDDAPPALILSVDESGIDLCICHAGMLLLDYRRAVANSPQETAQTVLSHLGRFQRYCERHVGFACGQISDIYLVGKTEILSELRHTLEEHAELNVHDLLDPWSAADAWHADDRSSAATMAAPLGLAMMRDSQLQRAAPNLLERVQARHRLPLSRLVRPLLFPLAATLLAVVMGWVAVKYQESRCSKLRRESAAIEVELRDARLLQGSYIETHERLKHLEAIELALGRMDWAQLFLNIAQCLPADVWLNTVSITRQHELSLSGASHSEDSVFELARWLGKVPHLSNINVRGMRPGRKAGASSTDFDINGEIDVGNESEGYADGRS